ncbi:hypothetical protein AMS68_000512 [Peltaster fructicola]|uniref:Uncharacterized protein n=1 Tax=Peltaster fructicola TaxID=286661 RepID=A0A6H0XK49_9PEZI|nr:hypothetical protein AMS68_000512 [Peltaster fructicola]
MSALNNIKLPLGVASQPLLGPLVALNVWTFFMEGWLYATRIPAFEKYKVKIGPSTTSKDLDAQLPPHVQWKGKLPLHLNSSNLNR